MSKDGTIDYQNKAEVIISKHRKGATGIVLTKFLGEYTLYADLDDDQFFVFINECYGSVFSVYRKVQYPQNIKSCDADVCGRRVDRFS